MDDVVEFRYPRGGLVLNMPVVMESMPISSLRKIFALLGRNHGFWFNDDSVRQFAAYIPVLLEELKEGWDKAATAQRDDYQSVYFYSWGGAVTDKNAIRARRSHNKRLVEEAKAAQARYERFLKRVPKLEELCRQYGDM